MELVHVFLIMIVVEMTLETQDASKLRRFFSTEVQ